MDNDNSPKIAKRFGCEKCDYHCRKESDFKKHTSSLKHKNGIQMELAGTAKLADDVKCIRCNKQYKSASGLWKHNKICIKLHEEPNTIILQNSPEEVKNLTSMVMELMKSNSELQKQMIEVCKNSNININSNNHSNNKTFNLQFFLNEQCKDAMNISDFANSFDLQISDLESVGELGYVDGITKLIVDKLNSMDVYKRPMHCSDAKRETIYVKDEDIWTKEGPDNPKLRKAIKCVSFNNMKLVYNWSNAYPESKDNQSRLNDKYMKLVYQSTGGSGPIVESENKIIRRIAKEIVIDKM
jgi:hypothetical protein